MSEILLAVYGTLRPRAGGWERLGLGRDAVREVAACRIPGRLLDLGPYPGLVLDADRVTRGDLVAIDDTLLPALDRYEGFDPADPAGSLFVRKRVRLIEPDVEAFVYELGERFRTAPEVPGGEWPARPSKPNP